MQSWLHCVEAAIRHGRALGPDYVEVRFEQLCTAPEAAARGILGGLGLADLGWPAGPAEGAVRRHTQRVHTDSIGSWRRMGFSSHERRDFDRACEHGAALLAELGYQWERFSWLLIRTTRSSSSGACCTTCSRPGTTSTSFATTGAFRHDPVARARHAEFRRLGRRLGLGTVGLGLPDAAGPLSIDDIANRLTAVAEVRDYDRVYTHGVFGEYGHQHHVDVCTAVHRVCQDVLPWPDRSRPRGR